jgi:hypothetical protein
MFYYSQFHFHTQAAIRRLLLSNLPGPMFHDVPLLPVPFLCPAAILRVMLSTFLCPMFHVTLLPIPFAPTQHYAHCSTTVHPCCTLPPLHVSPSVQDCLSSWFSFFLPLCLFYYILYSIPLLLHQHLHYFKNLYRPRCDSACNATGVGRLFLGGGAGEAR